VRHFHIEQCITNNSIGSIKLCFDGAVAVFARRVSTVIVH
jgi:hypothetical protein